MNMRSFTRKVLRSGNTVDGVRLIYQLARYAPARQVGKYSGEMATKTKTSEANAPIRRAFLASHVPGETARGRHHRLKEENLRRIHARGAR